MRENRIAHFFQTTLPLAAALVLTGCMGPRAQDVTNQPKWWGELKLNEVVELNQDTLCSGGVLELEARKFTQTGYDLEHTFGAPVTVEMFRANPEGFWADLFLVPKGTHLRLVKLERWFSHDEAAYRLSAQIVDRDLKGIIVYIVPWGDPNKKGSLELGPHPLVRPFLFAPETPPASPANSPSSATEEQP
jgi:hypothetical protein